MCVCVFCVSRSAGSPQHRGIFEGDAGIEGRTDDEGDVSSIITESVKENDKRELRQLKVSLAGTARCICATDLGGYFKRGMAICFDETKICVILSINHGHRIPTGVLLPTFLFSSSPFFPPDILP